MRPFKIGIVGVSRGKFILAMEELLREDIEVVAVCETNPKVIDTLREQKVLRDSVAVYDDFDAFLEHGLDAIMLCNYFHEHTPYAIRAMEKGIAVFSETTAAPSLGECVELVEAYEKYGGKYMLGANCLYFRAVQTMKKRMEEGKYGKISYADAEYVHPFVGGDPIPGLGKLDLDSAVVDYVLDRINGGEITVGADLAIHATARRRDHARIHAFGQHDRAIQRGGPFNDFLNCFHFHFPFALNS